MIVKLGFWLVLMFDDPLVHLSSSGFGRLLNAAKDALRDTTSVVVLPRSSLGSLITR